ncbi:hypothetical protein NEOKW01_2035 [Nematocida sp. AWRm80]|nr:hypothetical protein NEOKW01_2035 [Nematocida sp. AWRm80]
MFTNTKVERISITDTTIDLIGEHTTESRIVETGEITDLSSKSPTKKTKAKEIKNKENTPEPKEPDTNSNPINALDNDVIISCTANKTDYIVKDNAIYKQTKKTKTLELFVKLPQMKVTAMCATSSRVIIGTSAGELISFRVQTQEIDKYPWHSSPIEEIIPVTDDSILSRSLSNRILYTECNLSHNKFIYKNNHPINQMVLSTTGFIGIKDEYTIKVLSLASTQPIYTIYLLGNTAKITVETAKSSETECKSQPIEQLFTKHKTNTQTVYAVPSKGIQIDQGQIHSLGPYLIFMNDTGIYRVFSLPEPIQSFTYSQSHILTVTERDNTLKHSPADARLSKHTIRLLNSPLQSLRQNKEKKIYRLYRILIDQVILLKETSLNLSPEQRITKMDISLSNSLTTLTLTNGKITEDKVYFYPLE